MRLPEPPPVASPTATVAFIRKLAESSVQTYVDRVNASYLHWEDVRHRPPPAGLTPEEGWLAVKLSRHLDRRRVALLDEKKRPFSYWLPTSSLEALHAIDRGGGATLVDDAAAGSLEPIREQAIVSSLMEEAIATSQIEGAATTRKVAKEMLRANRRPRDRSEQMIVNSYRTIQLLREKTKEPLTLSRKRTDRG